MLLYYVLYKWLALKWDEGFEGSETVIEAGKRDDDVHRNNCIRRAVGLGIIGFQATTKRVFSLIF